MFFSIITILMAIVPFIMYTQPLFWAYTGEGMDAFNKGYKSTSCYQGINFEVDNGLYIAGCIFMIIALIFAGITILVKYSAISTLQETA